MPPRPRAAAAPGHPSGGRAARRVPRAACRAPRAPHPYPCRPRPARARARPQALKAEAAAQRAGAGVSVLGYDDALARLHPFLRRWRAARAADPRLRAYVVSADISKAFDTSALARARARKLAGRRALS